MRDMAIGLVVIEALLVLVNVGLVALWAFTHQPICVMINTIGVICCSTFLGIAIHEAFFEEA